MQIEKKYESSSEIELEIKKTKQQRVVQKKENLFHLDLYLNV